MSKSFAYRHIWCFWRFNTPLLWFPQPLKYWPAFQQSHTFNSMSVFKNDNAIANQTTVNESDVKRNVEKINDIYECSNNTKSPCFPNSDSRIPLVNWKTSTNPTLQVRAYMLDLLLPFFTLDLLPFLNKVCECCNHMLLDNPKIKQDLPFAFCYLFSSYFSYKSSRQYTCSSEEISKVFRHLNRLGGSEYVLHLFAQIPKALCKELTDVRTLNHPLRSIFTFCFKNISNPPNLLKLLTKLYPRSDRANEVLYTQYLGFLTKRGDYQIAIYMFDEMYRTHHWSSFTACRLMIESLVRQNKFEEAISLYKKIIAKRPKIARDKKILNLLLYISTVSNRSPDAFKLALQSISNANQIPSFDVFSRLMSALVKYNMTEMILPLVKQYDHKFRNLYSPNIFLSIVQALVFCGDMVNIQRWYNMSRINSELSRIKHLLNCFLNSSTVSLDVSMVLELLRDLKKKKIKVDERTLVICITIFSRRKDLFAMEKIHQYFSDQGIKTSNQAYAALLDAYIEAEDTEKIELYLGKIRRLGITEDVSINRMLMRLALDRLDWDLLEQCTKVAERKDPEGQDYLSTITMLYHVRQHELNLALRIFSGIQKPNVVHYSIAATVLGNLNQLDQLLLLEKRMESEGKAPTALSLVAFVSSYCKQGAEGLDEAKRYMSKNFQPDKRALLFNPRTANDMTYPPSLFSSLIKEYTSLGDIKEAKQVLSTYLEYFSKNITSKPDIPFAIASMRLYCSLHDTVLSRQFWDLILQVAQQNFITTDIAAVVDDKNIPSPSGVIPAYKSALNVAAETYFSFLASVNSFQELDQEWSRLEKLGFEYDDSLQNKRIIWLLYDDRLDAAIKRVYNIFLSSKRIEELIPDASSQNSIISFFLSPDSPLYFSTLKALRDKLDMAVEDDFVRISQGILVPTVKYLQTIRRDNEILFNLLAKV
ncbi:Pentatricopeptide repeat-containing protein 4, mitochondrial [Schizosaccharomyces pombe]